MRAPGRRRLCFRPTHGLDTVVVADRRGSVDRAAVTASRPHVTRRAAGAVIALALLAAACGGGKNPPSPSGSTSPAPPPTSAPPSPSPSLSPSPTASCAEQTLDGMTEAQRVGQLFMIGLANSQLGDAERSAIRAHHFGSVTFIQTSSVGVDATRAVTPTCR